MTKEQYIILFEKYQLGICTPEEIELLKNYQDEFQLNDLQWENEMGDKEKMQALIFSNIEKDMHSSQQVVVVSFWKRYRMIAAVAAIFILITVGVYLMFFNQPQKEIALNNTTTQDSIKDVAPGSDKAILTLANGSTIILDTAQNGVIAQQGNVQIKKSVNGEIVYSASNEKQQTITYNLLSTPRGGQYRLTLPDGSQVWLNAASSIRYPTAFVGNERSVTITGEAYFEVAKDASKPFKVSVNNMQVEVLGTHFNINAYDDEPSIKTTLLEGAVKINSNNTNDVLKPGQQAQINKSNALKILNDVNTDDVVAWKNGYISFTSSDLKTIMRQISRWYDVDVTYEGDVPERNFTGEISRKSNLSDLLKILQESNIHFKMNNKTLVVMP